MNIIVLARLKICIFSLLGKELYRGFKIRYLVPIYFRVLLLINLYFILFKKREYSFYKRTYNCSCPLYNQITIGSILYVTVKQFNMNIFMLSGKVYSKMYLYLIQTRYKYRMHSSIIIYLGITRTVYLSVLYA